jgi:hypothetical protein
MIAAQIGIDRLREEAQIKIGINIMLKVKFGRENIR